MKMLRPEQGAVMMPASLQAERASRVFSLHRPEPMGNTVPSTSNTTILILLTLNTPFTIILPFYSLLQNIFIERKPPIGGIFLLFD
jgi:hypothetical protein